MAIRVKDWRPHFRKLLTATQAAETVITLVGAGYTGDGTYDDFDTNMQDKGIMPSSDAAVLQGGGFMIELTSTPADARDLLVKLQKALFRIVINDYAELDWTPLIGFPAGVGYSIVSQDIVTAGKDLWAAIGNPDPKTMQGFNILAGHVLGEGRLAIQSERFSVPVAGGIALPPNTVWKVEVKLETVLALTTGNTAGLRFMGRGVYATTRVN